MKDIDQLLAIDHRPRIPDGPHLGIGIVGVGAVVQAGHLPAYGSAGFPVVAVADRDPALAARVAEQFGVPRWYGSATELLDDPDVEVVDIAITPDAQADVVRAAVAAGKHVLAQKPFSEDLGIAAELVALASRAGVTLAVNQQMRWDQLISCTKAFVEAGWYGELSACVIDVDVRTDWASWPWLLPKARLEYYYHSIHYVDALRYLFGQPVAVTASTARYPGQAARGETRSCTVYEFGGDLRATVLTNHNNWSHRPHATVRCQGTDGQSAGTLGALYDYPTGRPDTFEFWSRLVAPGHTFSRSFTERWIPDAFVGPMAELQSAVAEGREPLTSGRDNLSTLQVVQAAYRSAELGRRVAVDEIPIPGVV